MLRSVPQYTQYKTSKMAAGISSIKKVAADLIAEYFPNADGLDGEAKEARDFIDATLQALQYVESKLIPSVDKRNIPYLVTMGRIAAGFLKENNKLINVLPYYFGPKYDDSIKKVVIVTKITIQHEASVRFANALLNELRKWPADLSTLLPFVDYAGIVKSVFEPGWIKDSLMKRFSISPFAPEKIENIYKKFLPAMVAELETQLKPHMQKSVDEPLVESEQLLSPDIITNPENAEDEISFELEHEEVPMLHQTLSEDADAQTAIAFYENKNKLLLLEAERLTADLQAGQTEKKAQAIAWFDAKKKTIDEFIETQNNAIMINFDRKQEAEASGRDASHIQKSISDAGVRIAQKADELNAMSALTKALDAIVKQTHDMTLVEKSAEHLASWSQLDTDMTTAFTLFQKTFSDDDGLAGYANLQAFFVNAKVHVAAMLALQAQHELNARQLNDVREREEARKQEEARRQEEERVRAQESAECKRYLVMQRINNFIEDKKIFYKGQFACDQYEAEYAAIANALMVFAGKYDGRVESSRYLTDLATLTDKYPGWNLTELQRKINSVVKIDAAPSNAAADIEVPVTYKQAQIQLDEAIMDMARYAISIYDENNKKSLTCSAAALDLALELAGMKNEFFRDANKVNSQDEFNKFQAQFSKVLHSRDDVISEHRAKWKVVVANIAIALTLIGTLILTGRAVASCITGKSIMFFARTNRRQQLDRIEKSLDVMAKEQTRFLEPPAALSRVKA